MTLNKAPTHIKLPNAQETQFQSEINTRAKSLFDRCRKLRPVVVFQGEKTYPKEWKISGELYRITRQSSGRCKFEFPNFDQLSAFTTLRDGTGIDAFIAARDSQRNTSFTTGAWSQVELLPLREKIETAFSVAEAALEKLEQFIQSEAGQQTEKTGRKVEIILT